MMKAIMRLDKSQVSSKRKVSSGAGLIFDRDIAIMAGYKNYELTLIGGSGGKAGDCTMNTNTFSAGAGGGGGGLLHIKSTLASLPLARMLIWAGSAGADGADSAVGSYAGDGYDGLPSYLSDPDSTVMYEQVYGGKGALGGKVRKNSSGTVVEIIPSVAGAGGGNSRGYGTTGVGAVQNHYDNNWFGPSTSATMGTYADATPGTQTGGGGGGGGGKGRVSLNGAQYANTSGGSGNYEDFGIYTMTGEPVGAKKGGSGGGGRYAPDNEFYGAMGVGGLAVIVLT